MRVRATPEPMVRVERILALKRCGDSFNRMPLPTQVGSLHLDTADAASATGANVLCLHGLFAGSWVFEQLLPLIAERGHSAAALSFRGHPPNAPLPDIGNQSVTAFANDAAEACKALERPIVIGHSLGGLIALLLAGRNLARAAIVIAPAPPRGIPVLHPQLLLRMSRYLPALLLSRAFRPTDADLDALVLNMVPPGERAALRARFVKDSGRAARQTALGVFKVPPRAMRAPVLVVTGDEDRFIPMRIAQRVAQTYTAPLHVARGHGHFLLSEPGWEEHAGIMLDWVEGLPRPIREADKAPPLPSR